MDTDLRTSPASPPPVAVSNGPDDPHHGRARARRELRDGRRGPRPFGRAFAAAVDARAHEADEFYAPVIPSERSEDERRVMRQAFAGLLWSNGSRVRAAGFARSELHPLPPTTQQLIVSST